MQLFRGKGATALVALLILTFLSSRPAFAHVKWFSDFSFLDRPRSLGDILTPMSVSLALLSAVVIGALVLVERSLKQTVPYQRVRQMLIERRNYSYLIMRVGMGATFLLMWQADAFLAPELHITRGWIGWLEFLLALLLLFEITSPAAGVGLLLLYLLAIADYGVFHMMDYLHYIGIAIYLLVGRSKNAAAREIGLPLLFFTVGFSLMWLAIEKLVYPEWSLILLQGNPQLTLGLDPAFFLRAAAFVELSLGYLILIVLLERPLALVITLVFVMTTTIFGKTEIIGHTPVHAALLVFLLQGPGTLYVAPSRFHKRLNWRVAFAAVNFLLVTMVIAVIYVEAARIQFVQAVEAAETEVLQQLVPNVGANTFFEQVTISEDLNGGYNLRVDLLDRQFAAPPVDSEWDAGEVFAVVTLDGEEIGRMYSNWFYIGALAAGEHAVGVTLFEGRKPLTVAGEEATVVKSLIVK